MNERRLFVYGTLKRGYCRAHYLQGQVFLGEAVTQPGYRMYNCGEYPGLIAAADGGAIEGELWAVDAERLAILDQVESLDAGLFKRDLILLSPPFEEDSVEAYFYRQSVRDLHDCGCRW